MRAPDNREIQSEALKINLRQTNVTVSIQAPFLALLEGVKGYAGKEQQAENLLNEYHHPYRNWSYVVEEAWRYAVSNLRLYGSHPLNGRITFLLSYIFLDALKESEQRNVRSLASDRFMLFWIKVLDEMGDATAEPAPDAFLSGDLDPHSIEGYHQGILRFYLLQLNELSADAFQFLMQSYYQPRQLARRLLSVWPDDASFRELRLFLQRLLEETYRLWLQNDDPCEWLIKQEKALASDRSWVQACAHLGHEAHRKNLTLLEEIKNAAPHRDAVERLLELPDFRDIVQSYHRLPKTLRDYDSPSEDRHLSILMQLKIMETRGLEGVHEETLRDINFELARWIREEPSENLQNFLGKIFNVLAGCIQTYPVAALQCLRTIGLEILKTEDRPLIQYFNKRAVEMGFQTPSLRGISEHWQIRMNPAHLTNIRVWLELIRENPAKTKPLLSALIVNLSLGGIAVRDTDLFQKDVSYLLHAPIEPVYNLVKQLAKIFPVYFSQIGAEGQLRTVSTDVDELSERKDRLIHFLRKQSHVEGNNLIVRFIEAIIAFWRDRDKSRLQPLVPAEVYEAVSESGPYVDEIHKIFEALFSRNRINHVEDLLDLREEEVREIIDEVPEASERERRRALLMIRFYQLLNEKYALSFKDIRQSLERAAHEGMPDPSRLLQALESEDEFEKLDAILDYLAGLNAIILQPGELNIFENIYYKRHIAVDIPSMYGSYNERKFDALGLTFRLEKLANVLFEEILLSFNLSFITRATFFRIAKFLPCFMKALQIDGITSNRLEMQTELFQKALEIRRFSHSQYVDIFRGFSEAIKEVIQTYYHGVHEENLNAVIPQLGIENLRERYRRDGREESQTARIQRISETFLRDLVARTFGLQYFDHFISSIMTTLANQKEVLSAEKLDLLLSYDPEKTLSFIDDPSPLTYDIIHLGGKGYNLAKLDAHGIRVPPGFIITTEYFRCQDVVENFIQSNEDFRNRVMGNVSLLARRMSRCFGCENRSLLLSVRSGSSVSMPGMMNSFLNVGINERIVEGLVQQTGEAWFAWDNYRRFLQSWGMAFGMERNEFDDIMSFNKRRTGKTIKREFTPEEMRRTALDYKETLYRHGIDFSEDPQEQLFTAIRKVIESWFSRQAYAYREIMGYSHNWGTAVTVQAMVFGNLDTSSGAGVVLTHNPWTAEPGIEPTGDFTRGNQGEDVVGGLVQTLPISEKQRLSQRRPEGGSLESLFPDVYRALVRVAEQLVYEHNWSPQEVEFTFMGDREENLYILQSRNMSARIKRRHPIFKSTSKLKKNYIGSGIGVSGGALSGMVAFDLESIESLRRNYPEWRIIFIRSDTVPEDIREISVADGILTGKGGATSHAAIVAHRLEKTCVVGFNRMKVWESAQECAIDGHVLRTGDMISMDGRSGEIYLGIHETQLVDLES